MRVCYFGTYEREYPRNALVIAGLRQAGVTVWECHEPVWERQHDKSGAYRGLAALAMLLRLLQAYLRLIVRYWRTPVHDVVIVGYIGQFDLLLAWILTRLRKVSLVFNPLVSLYDTFCDDRGLVKAGSLTGRAFWLLDYLACRLADLVVLDTAQQVDYFASTFRLPAKFRVLPVGADDHLFQAQPLRQRQADEPCEVLFVGKLIPLHGCETILQAAALLRDQPVHFTIVGSGQQHALVQRLVAELGLTHVTLIDWIEYHLLPDCYAQADLCLGIFGASSKAARVIPNKVFQALAMGRPVLTADSPALRSELRPGEEVWVCRPADAADLARQIITLAGDAPLRQRLAEMGSQAFQQRYSVYAIGAGMRDYLLTYVSGGMGNGQYGVSLSTTSGHKQAWRVLGSLVAALSLFYILLQLWSAWPQLAGIHLEALPALLALWFVGLSLLVNALLWRSTLRRLGTELGLWAAVRIWFVSQIARYTPGNVWHLLGRTYLAQKEGAGVGPLSLSMVLELWQAITAALLVATLSLLFWQPQSAFAGWLLLLIPLLIAYAWPQLLERPIAWVLGRAGQPSSGFTLHRRDLFALLPGYCATWLLYGCGLYLLALAIYQLPLTLLPAVTGIYAIAWVLGFLSFITPSGLGVREGVLGYLLASLMPVPIALLLTLLARVWWTVAELGCVAVVVCIRRKRT